MPLTPMGEMIAYHLRSALSLLEGPGEELGVTPGTPPPPLPGPSASSSLGADSSARVALPSPPASPLAWGAKVSPVFRERVRWIADQLGLDPNWLMACMAFETGRRFTANVRSPVSTATGLIQFMRATAQQLGTTIEALAAMTAEDQLNYVYKYFQPYAHRIHSLSDCYMVILWPTGVGKEETYPIFVEGTSTYAANAGLDANHDHRVTKAEAAHRLAAW
jgi:hypothetical protein